MYHNPAEKETHPAQIFAASAIFRDLPRLFSPCAGLNAKTAQGLSAHKNKAAPSKQPYFSQERGAFSA
ncbi:MAG: hypothetical protein ACLT3G_04430 [Acutalibacteraceae bacterium]